MTHNTREVEEIVKEFAERNDCILCYGKNQKQMDRLRITLHHQLQKARQDWLREEIVKLEGMKMNKAHVLIGNMEFQVESLFADGHDQSLQTIIDRYLAELDQLNK